MPRAYVVIREKPCYRSHNFIDGIAKLGFSVHRGAPVGRMDRSDVLIIWNRLRMSDASVKLAMSCGAAVIVAENGYAGKDHTGWQSYALALDGHNGSGRWYAPKGDDSRLKRLQLDLKPFREETGRKVVIAAQRGIGSNLMRSPQGFAEKTFHELQAVGFEPYIRPHPGNEPPKTRLMDDLEGASALVTWSSNAATEALINGVPTYFAAPAMVTSPGARMYSPTLGKGNYDHLRYEGLIRMSWAQAFVDEIVTGEPFERLLQVHRGELPSCAPGIEGMPT